MILIEKNFNTFDNLNILLPICIDPNSQSSCPNRLNLVCIKAVCTWAAGETTRAGSASGCREERAAKSRNVTGEIRTTNNHVRRHFISASECSHPGLLSTHLHEDARSLGRREGDFVHEVRDVPGRVREAGVKSVSQWVNRSVGAWHTWCMTTKQPH